MRGEANMRRHVWSFVLIVTLVPGIAASAEKTKNQASKAFVEKVVTAVRDYAAPADPGDDVTVLLVQRA